MSERSPVVLVVEDEKQIRQFVRTALEQEGCRVYEAGTSAQGLIEAGQQKPDLLVLDLGLPDGNGIDFISALRGWSDAPILVLSARTHERDKVLALDVGADDYLTKPFDPRELLARLRAVLRRASDPVGARNEDTRLVISFAGWHLDVTRRELRSSADVMIPLSGGEFDLLVVFLEHPERILSREQLIDLTHGSNHEAFDRSIDVQVSRLRRKIEPDSKRPDLIRTVRNGGYLFNAKVTRT